MPKFCSNCGSPLVEDARFCPVCGQPVAQEAAPAQPEQPAYQPEQPAYQPEQPAYQPEQPAFQPYTYQQPQEQAYAYQQPQQPQEQGYAYQQPQQSYAYQQPQEQAYAYQQPQQPQEQGYAYQQPQQSYAYQQPQEQGYAQYPQAQPPRKKSAAGPIAAVAAVLLIGLAAVACFVWPGWLKGEGGEPAAPTATGAPALSTEAPASTPAATAAPATEAPTLPATETAEPTTEPLPSNPFLDASEDDYAYENFYWCYRRGLIEDGYVEPYAELTRGQVILLLWKAEGSPAASISELPFTDVSADDSCYPALLWACEQGIVSGSGGTYRPAETATNAQAITILCAALGGSGEGLDRAFIDIKEGKYYYNPANWGFYAGIVDRYDDFCFYPDDNLWRGDYLCWLSRALEPALTLTPSLPWTVGFEDYQVEPDVSSAGPGSFLAASKDDRSVRKQLSVTLESYKRFEQAEGYEAREGYEWRVAQFLIGYGEEDASNYSYSLYLHLEDYYYTDLFDDSYNDDADCDTAWVVWQDRLYQVYMPPMDYEVAADALFRVHYAVQVPKGYDGLCVYFISYETNEAQTSFLDNYSAENYAIFRFD